jgi:hypothetical protein
LEVGTYTSTTLPPFQHESYGDNLARCQRYFYGINGIAADQTSTESNGFANSTSAYRLTCDLPVPMRVYPTVTEVGMEVNHYNAATASSLASLQENANTTLSPSSIVTNWDADSGTPFTTGAAAFLRVSSSTSAYLRFDSEL